MFKLLTARTAVTAAAAAAALSLALVATSQTQAAEQQTTTTVAPVAASSAAQSVSGSPVSAFSRIADFYGSYIDAVYSHTDNGKAAQALRSFYLSKSLQRSLKTWEAREHADGVLRAQDVPLKWKVTSTGSGMGKANATVTLTWGGGTHSTIKVQADLRTKDIVAIKG
ncbi:hypothetical protein [Streptomyces sp. NPDC089919]|uniref:hypothetical protein n=1 Tax=Streptomyces sp. NPDC089919 TaxID=3155188 RepID=UPI00342FC06A